VQVFGAGKISLQRLFPDPVPDKKNAALYLIVKIDRDKKPHPFLFESEKPV
jgi:hypothetical protein